MITLNMMMDALKSYRKDVHVADIASHSFHACLPLPAAGETLRADVLYIGGLSAVLELPVSVRGNAVCICLRDRIQDHRETQQAMSSLIVVNENIPPLRFLGEMQSYFFDLTDWITQLYVTVSKNLGIQAVMDLSYPVIPNHIQITDASFMRLASTKNVECDDPICVSLAETGYHPESTVAKFREHNLFTVWSKATDIFYDPDVSVAKYPTLHKIYKHHGIYYAHAVMTCNNVSITPGLKDKFRTLMNAVSICIERQWDSNNAGLHTYDSFLIDLIEGRLENRKEIEERASYLNLPVSGSFELLRIAPRNNETVVTNILLMDFANLFPRMKLVNYMQNIICISPTFSPEPVDDEKNTLELMHGFLEKYDADCGVSLPYRDLTDLRYCYQQASLALKYPVALKGKKVTGSVLRPMDQRVHFFSQSFPYAVLSEGENIRDIWYHSEYHDKLQALYQTDQEQKTEHFKLLCTYLSCERRIGETASLMGLHRNSITYRVERLKELLGMDFENPTVRKALLCCIDMITLYGFLPK